MKMTVTPGPKRYDVGCHHVPCDGTLLLIRPAQSRQLRVSRHVICTGTWELLSRFAWKQDAKMPACGQEDGGGVVAKGPLVMGGTG